MDLNLDKKIIVLAGGSGAIGLDACKLLLEEGSILIIIDKEKPLIKEKTKNLICLQEIKNVII